MPQLLSIETSYLRYCVALAEELNYRKAAERLRIAGPTLSIQIKKLEDMLEAQLFERSPTHVRLTELGEVLLRDAHKVLQNMDALTAAIHKAKQEEQGENGHGHLRIGLPGNFNNSFFLKALATYRERYPQVDVKLTGLKMDEDQTQALDEGRIHIGFAVNYNFAAMRKLRHLMIMNLPIYALMGTQHPLAAKKEVTTAELAAYPVLAMKPHREYVETVAAFFHEKKLQPKIEITDTIECCATMLATGEAVSLITDIRPMAHSPGLTLRPIKDATPAIRLQLNAVWKKNGATPHAVKFIEVLRELRECPKDCECPHCGQVGSNCPHATTNKTAHKQPINKQDAMSPCNNCYLSKQAI